MELHIKSEYVDGVGCILRATVSEKGKRIDGQIRSRMELAGHELRNAAEDVLDGERSGRVYRKYPFKSTYTASAPGEPPARRTGALRLGWKKWTEIRPTVGGTEILAVLENTEPYAVCLEEGTKHMAPRPFANRIVERAKPKILQIFEKSYK